MAARLWFKGLAGLVSLLVLVGCDPGEGERALADSRVERAVVDRLVDGRWAVLLVGPGEEERVVDLKLLPPGAGEGTWLRLSLAGDEVLALEVDEEETRRVRERLDEKLARLRQRGRRLP